MNFANYKDAELEIYPTIVYACTAVLYKPVQLYCVRLYKCILTSLVILVVRESNDRH